MTFVKANVNSNLFMQRLFLPRSALAFTLLLMLGLALPVQATALGEQAAQMSPGQWLRLNTVGDASGLTYDLLNTSTGSTLAYLDKGKWDPFLRRAFFIGQGASKGDQKFIQYDEASNRWSQLPDPYWEGGNGHGYQHNTINPATGDLYYRKFNTTNFYRLDRASGQWSQLPAPSINYVGVAGGLEYFPEMGGLVFVSCMNVAVFVNDRWTTLYNGTLPMAQYNNVTIYSKQHQVVYLGGGNNSRDLYKLTANQAVVRIPDPPTPVGVNSTVTTVDPVTGNLLIFTGNAAYQYSNSASTWSRLTLNGSPITTVSEVVAIPIDTYGVIMFLKLNSGKPDVWLYRHSPSAATPIDTTPPTVPSGITIR